MKKIYKTIIRVEVLSETPVHFSSLREVHDAIHDDCSGLWENVSCEALTGKQAAEAVMAQGSSPEFFGIDENGEEIEI